MKLGVGFFQIRDGQAEVTLCGGEGAVAKQILDVAEAGMVLDEMSRAAVAPDVRCDDLLDLGQLRVLFDQGAQGMGIQRMPPVGDEKPVALTCFQQNRTSFDQVGLEC